MQDTEKGKFALEVYLGHLMTTPDGRSLLMATDRLVFYCYTVCDCNLLSLIKCVKVVCFREQPLAQYFQDVITGFVMLVY